jgi:hypothetical protein
MSALAQPVQHQCRRWRQQLPARGSQAARCWLNAGQHLGRRAAGGAACGRRSACRLAVSPCQHRCGTGVMPVLQPTWMDASCHQQESDVNQPAALGGGARLLGRPGRKGLAHAAQRCKRCSLTAGRRPSSAARTLGWVPAHPCQPQPRPSSACAASARERHGRAAAGACWCGAEGMARARGAPSASSQTLAMHATSGALSTSPIAARERRGRLRSSMPWRAPRPGRARGSAAGGPSSEPRCRARR